MDKFRSMSVFVAIAEAGSLSGAARRLNEPLTNVSRNLSLLEASLGCTLADRTTRRMALTDAGRRYLEASRRVLEELETAEAQIAGEAADLSGEIAITAPVVFGRLHVLPVVGEFLAAYPRITARIVLADRVVDLMEEELDVAVRAGDLPDSSLQATRVATLRMLTCAAPAFLERCGTPASPAALASCDCVTFSGLPGGQRWVFKSARHGRKAVRVTPRLSVNTADAAAAAAVAGVGVTRLLSYQAQAAIDAGQLKPVLTAYDDTEIPVHLVYRQVRAGNPRVRAFVHFAAKRLRGQLGHRGPVARRDREPKASP